MNKGNNVIRAKFLDRAPFAQEKLRDGEKLLVFHGNPKPAAALRGEWKGRFKRMRKTPWIADYWY